MAVIDILLAVLGICVLIIVHETGHYLVARAFGMRVLRYSIGFGPALIKYQPKGSPTVFQLSVIPLLAYVQIAGMNPFEENDPDDPGLYSNKGVVARSLTIFAGPFANYLAASLIAFTLAMTAGWPETVSTEPMVVGSVSNESPAAEAGLKAGDVILMANGESIRNVEDLIRVTASRAGKPTEYIVEREGTRLEPLSITPMAHEDRAIIGVAAKSEQRFRPLPLAEAAQMAVVAPYYVTVAQINGISSRIREGSTEGIMGPPGMVKELANHAKRGPADFMLILMVLSVALGFINLMPLPALDGGRLVFLAYEVITRRRPNERFEAMVHTVGLLFLLSLLVLVSYRDMAS